jgi:hypothetical protein
MNIERDKPPAIKARPWREPYDVFMAFVKAATMEERELLRPRIPWACREFRKRTYYLKRDNYRAEYVTPRKAKPHALGGDATLRDQELHPAVNRLFDAMRTSAPIDEDSRRRILAELERLDEHYEN